MAWEGKKYKLDRQDNFEEYMKALGVGLVLRKMGNSVTPTVHIEKNGDEYQFHTVSTFKTLIIKFKLGEEFDEETLDGRKVKSVIVLDGPNTFSQIQKTKEKSTIIRAFTDTEMIATCTYGNVTTVRYYKVV